MDDDDPTELDRLTDRLLTFLQTESRSDLAIAVTATTRALLWQLKIAGRTCFQLSQVRVYRESDDTVTIKLDSLTSQQFEFAKRKHHDDDEPPDDSNTVH